MVSHLKGLGFWFFVVISFAVRVGSFIQGCWGSVFSEAQILDLLAPTAFLLGFGVPYFNTFFLKEP